MELILIYMYIVHVIWYISSIHQFHSLHTLETTKYMHAKYGIRHDLFV